MPARTGCCQKPANYCGWNPLLNPYAPKQLSGDLTIVESGGQFLAFGTGTTVLRGILGTGFLGGPGQATNLYGRIQYAGQQCGNQAFVLILEDDLIMEYAPNCVLRIPAATYTLQLGDFGGPFGNCCLYYAVPYAPAIGAGIRKMFTLSINKVTGAAVLRVEVPFDGSMSIGTPCINYYAAIYVGSLSGDSISLAFSTYSGPEPSGGVGCESVIDYSPGDIPETSNFPESLSLSALNTVTTLWTGIRNSIGIAVHPSTRTFSAVMLDSNGQITSTIASVTLTGPTLATPFGAFWWNETGKAQFAIFDQKPPPASLGYFDVLDYIAMDVDADQPDLDTYAYLGASGLYGTFTGRIQCVGFPSCWPQYAINQTTQQPPFSWRIDGFDSHSPCILWNGHGATTPGRVLQNGDGCEWVNAWGTGTEGFPPGSGDVLFVFDIGLTDPTTVNLRMHFTFTTAPDPLSGAQDTYHVDAQWSMPIADFDGYTPAVLSIYESSSDEPSGVSVCLPPLTVTMVPL